MSAAQADSIATVATHCPICEGQDNDEILYPARVSADLLNVTVYSARQPRQGRHNVHFRIVRCRNCGLVRSDPIASPERIGELYRLSHFAYEQEAENLRKTYGYYLSDISRFQSRKQSLLEIGCGNGFFLEEAMKQGYTDVWGVEPSASSKDQAPPAIRDKIIVDLFKPGLFKENTFDCVCLFHVLDHIVDLNTLLQECRRVLRPGGLLFCIHHDVKSWSARLLRERSPIIDVQHIHLFDHNTIREIARKNGFKVLLTDNVSNIFTIRHCMKLFPMSGGLKKVIMNLFEKTRIANIKIRLKPGNLRLVAQKPG